MAPVGFPGYSMVTDLPAMQETQVQSLGLEDPLEKEMATHSSILVWRIPWTEDAVFYFFRHKTLANSYIYVLYSIMYDYVHNNERR